MISINEFKKIDFRIGEIKCIEGSKVNVICNNKEYIINLKLKIKVKDKVVIIIDGGRLVIPVVNGDIPLVPEKEIKEGSKVR